MEERDDALQRVRKNWMLALPFWFFLCFYLYLYPLLLGLLCIFVVFGINTTLGEGEDEGNACE